jgi:hypothetical protein
MLCHPVLKVVGLLFLWFSFRVFIFHPNLYSTRNLKLNTSDLHQLSQRVFHRHVIHDVMILKLSAHLLPYAGF